ncbi:DUF3556 domain-containing protein [Pseudonocardia spinosispora]|uniref:DUF3556 domain-containing protein n=1 Tax=Pseudonocardia spinosispora TaxID=103441 RepID=UPI000417423F|nr:DUF3556 domain-containing protein [Pseudonocardia spinosispora]
MEEEVALGFLAPKMPPFNLHFWYWGRRSERLRPMAQHWSNYGPALPGIIYIIYVVKFAAFLVAGAFIIAATPGLGTLEQIGAWWTEPVVFQKAIIWAMLVEVTGFGGGFGPLTMRFLPPLGGLLYWLRPGTIRMPPWPGRVPLTGGTRRGLVDVLLYLGLLASAIWLLASPATHADAGVLGPVTTLDPLRLLPLAVLLPLIGLRDKTVFLASRPEHYWVLVLAFFLPFLDMVVAAKILLVLMWWGAATSKLGRIWPFTLSVILTHNPLTHPWFRRRLFRAPPDNMLPSRSVTALAWFVTLIEYVVPLALLVATNRTAILLAVFCMALFHIGTLMAMPVAVPHEWNLTMIFSVMYLFGGYPTVDLGSTTHPLFPALLALPVVVLITWGNLRPDQISYLVSMRYYAGNWPTSMWALKPSALAKIDKNVVKYSGFPKDQLKKMYGEQIAELFAHTVLTFRSLHHHGRALFGLLPRAAGQEHESAVVIEGELVCGTLLGWNFGEGHLHGEQLVAALQERCDFEPGELRVVFLESAVLGSDRQHYRLVDGANGVFETGYVLMSDMVNRQPWEIDNLPACVLHSTPMPLPEDEFPALQTDVRVPEPKISTEGLRTDPSPSELG